MTTIGKAITITGDISSDEDVRLDGCVHGRVLVRNARLIVGTEGRASADLRGARVHIEGNVDGAVSATERIELAATAVVSGSLSANYVVLADGASFNGRIDMDRRTIAIRLARYRTAAGASV